MKFERLLSYIPGQLLGLSGEVFYSGKSAYVKKNDLYLLGLNPGSDSADASLNSIGDSIEQTSSTHPPLFSRYLDERWSRRYNRFSPMQRRIQHLAQKMNIDLRQTPASNLVFTRSVAAKDISTQIANLADLCWPLHQAIIYSLKTRVVICLGGETFTYVSKKLGATQHFATYTETNSRRWQSQAFRNTEGIFVVKLTHPGRANWISANADPSPLVCRVRDEAASPRH